MSSNSNSGSFSSSDSDLKSAAEVKIFSYYKALTDGCGDKTCDNNLCVSSGKGTALPSNEAAARALQLLSDNAPLCKSMRSNASNEQSTSSTEREVAEVMEVESTDAVEAEKTPVTPMEMEALPVLSNGQEASTSNETPMNLPSMNLEAMMKENIDFRVLSSDFLQSILELCKKDENYSELKLLLHSFSSVGLLERSFKKKKPAEKTEPVVNMEENTESPIVNNLDSFVEPLIENVMEMSTEGIPEEMVISNKEKLRSSETDTEKDVDDSVDVVDSKPPLENNEILSKKPEEKNLIENGEFSGGSVVESTDNLDSSVADNQSAKDNIEASKRTVIRGISVVSAVIPEVDLDLEDLHKFYRILKDTVPLEEYTEQLLDAQKCLLSVLTIKYKVSRNIFHRDNNVVNLLVILLENHLFDDNDFTERLLEVVVTIVDCLSVQQKAILVLYLARHWDAQKMSSFLTSLHHFITIKLITTQSGIGKDSEIEDYEQTICFATDMINVLFMASIVGGEVTHPLIISLPEGTNVTVPFSTQTNYVPKRPEFVDNLSLYLGIHPLDSKKPLVNFSDFHNEFLSDQLEIDKDYSFYKTGEDKFSFLNYPFILTAAFKSRALYFDNRLRMFSERRLSIYMLSDGIPSTPYLRLRARRDHIIEDTLVELEVLAMDSPSDLRKQLVVEFEGEQGVDEGGVSKEFFQLITEELFCLDYGMFTEHADSGFVWFNPRSFESEAQFTLVGLVLGLAIYNNIILDLKLPSVLYKKLTGKPGSFHDLECWNPTIYRSMLSLLEYEGDDMEDVFVQNFRVGYQDIFGESICENLKENGEDILVNQQNKHEFVTLYSDWLLNKMVQAQFTPFLKGFLMVTGDTPLRSLFRPEELELLLTGSKKFDWDELQKHTSYEGFDAKHPVVKWFWEIINEMSVEEQMKFLQFTTGSSRVPVGGMSELKLVISRNGADDVRLPTAHTCFNVLMLPQYSSKENLQQRLLLAIEYNHGFGML